MRASHYCCALLVVATTHLAHADEIAAKDAPSMELIEMLGGADDETVDLDIAMSKVKLAEKEAAPDGKGGDTPEARETNAGGKPAAEEVRNAK